MIQRKTKSERNCAHRHNFDMFLFSALFFCSIFCCCQSAYSLSIKCVNHTQSERCNIDAKHYNNDFAPKEVIPPLKDNLSAITQSNLNKDHKDTTSSDTEELYKNIYRSYTGSTYTNNARTHLDGLGGFLIHRQLTTNA